METFRGWGRGAGDGAAGTAGIKSKRASPGPRRGSPWSLSRPSPKHPSPPTTSFRFRDNWRGGGRRQLRAPWHVPRTHCSNAPAAAGRAGGAAQGRGRGAGAAAHAGTGPRRSHWPPRAINHGGWRGGSEPGAPRGRGRGSPGAGGGRRWGAAGSPGTGGWRRGKWGVVGVPPAPLLRCLRPDLAGRLELGVARELQRSVAGAVGAAGKYPAGAGWFTARSRGCGGAAGSRGESRRQVPALRVGVPCGVAVTVSGWWMYHQKVLTRN